MTSLLIVILRLRNGFCISDGKLVEEKTTKNYSSHGSFKILERFSLFRRFGKLKIHANFNRNEQLDNS